MAKTERTVLYNIKLSPAERREYQREADIKKVSLADWIRLACDDAASRGIAKRARALLAEGK